MNYLKSIILLGAHSALIASHVDAQAESLRLPDDRTKTNYAAKRDFATIEHKVPLTPKQLNSITPESLLTQFQDQEGLDQLYARLTSGPIPEGPFDGKIVLAPNGGMSRVIEIFRKAQIIPAQLKPEEMVKMLGETLWRGKHFYPDSNGIKGNTLLRNRMLTDDISVLSKLFAFTFQIKRDPAIDEANEYRLFPAKVYCGQSLLDSRRESIIIDYAFTDEISGYRASIDSLAGRTGLKVRDEVRMVRPGFYLGRAYLDRMFGLNFTLVKKDGGAGKFDESSRTLKTDDTCWTGTQNRRYAQNP